MNSLCAGVIRKKREEMMATKSSAARSGKRPRRKGPGRLSAEDAADLPNRLLDAALVLFTQDGFAKTSLERIARKAGASTKTVYSRYANKTEILNAVIRRIIDGTLAEHAAATAVDPRNLEPRVFLVSFARQVTSRLEGVGLGLNRLAFAEAHRHPELGKLASSVIKPGVAMLKNALTRWHEQGLLPHFEGDPELIATLCLTSLTDRPRIRAVLGDPLTREELDAHITATVDIFLRGLGYAPRER